MHHHIAVKWTEIGGILGRYSVACKDAYRRMALKETTKTGSWTDEENEKLTRLVVLHNDDPECQAGNKTYVGLSGLGVASTPFYSL